MRITRTWTISLPPEMGQLAQAIAKAEHRTKSELIREALRHYFAQRGQPINVSALAGIYRRRASNRKPTEAELRRKFRGVKRMHERLKHFDV